MPTISVTADALSYREVLLTCVQASEWQMALHLQEQMHQQSLQPDVASYSALLMECQQRALEHEIPLLQSLTALSEGGPKSTEAEAFWSAALDVATAVVRGSASFTPELQRLRVSAGWEGPVAGPYGKELELLRYVLLNAEPG
ncbi:unnamed protein product, partial [Durusdinium trenchii]